MTAGRMTLTRQASETIGRAIADGTYEPGDRLSPEYFLTECGISRTVFREAIQYLTAKGMLVAKPQVGTRVRPQDQWNVMDDDVTRWIAGTPIGDAMAVHARQFHAMLSTRPDMADNPYYKAALAAVTKADTP